MLEASDPCWQSSAAHRFFLDGLHVSDDEFLGERQLVDAFKAFLQVWLNAGRVLGLRQDLEHFVIREEEESGEEEPLFLQISCQTLLDFLE